MADDKMDENSEQYSKLGMLTTRGRNALILLDNDAKDDNQQLRLDNKRPCDDVKSWRNYHISSK